MAKEKATPTPKTGTDTVTIALKHPTGIVLEAFEKVATKVPDGGGRMREEMLYRSTGKQYPLYGNRVPMGMTPNYKIIAGYALTPGIPRDVWEAWKEQHHDSPLLDQANPLIFAHESLEQVEDFAEEGRQLRHGFEPLRKTDDPRVAKRKTRDGKFVDSVSMADDQPKSEAA
jgi:hypothetical protein